MSTTIHDDRQPAHVAADTRVAPPGRNHTPLPLEFAFLRPPHEDGELGRLGGYRVLKLLGAGGMGKVFLAEDLGLKREVALKVMCLPPGEDMGSWRERFLREARAQAAARHPNLVTVFQVGEDRGTVFLAMELLEGETLEARVRREAPLPVPEAVRIAEDVLRGLSAIHARGLIHRDIKPANIWLTGGIPTAAPVEPADPLCFTAEPPPRVEAPAAPPAKILDFGLVREVRSGTQLTEAGAVVGTPAYMSPEQARGRPLDHRTDLFSFGCVLYAAVTGRPPFAADTPMAQAAALAADTPIPARQLNPDVPRALSDLIDDLLAKEPDGRPFGADDVLDRLHGLGDREAEEKAPRPAPRARQEHPHRHWYAIAGVVAIGLVAAAAAIFSLTRGPAGDKDRSEKVEKAAPAPAKPVKPVKPPEPPGEYLADLTAIRTVQFPPPGRPIPPGLDGPLTVGGAKVPHAILMHPGPPKDLPAQQSFVLNGAYARLVADVGFNDSADRGAAPVGFVVVADGRPIWQSRPMVVGQPPERVDVDVRGVNTLLLSTVALGPHHQGAHAVWIDPRLTK